MLCWQLLLLNFEEQDLQALAKAPAGTVFRHVGSAWLHRHNAIVAHADKKCQIQICLDEYGTYHQDISSVTTATQRQDATHTFQRKVNLAMLRRGTANGEGNIMVYLFL